MACLPLLGVVLELLLDANASLHAVDHHLQEPVVVASQVVRRYLALPGSVLGGAQLHGVLVVQRGYLVLEHAHHLVGELRDLDEVEVGAYFVLLIVSRGTFGCARWAMGTGVGGGKGGGQERRLIIVSNWSKTKKVGTGELFRCW